MSEDISAGAVIYSQDIDRLAAFYLATIGFREHRREATYVALRANGFELVLVKAGEALGSESTSERRSMAAIKLGFVVPSIADARASAAIRGGLINAARHEWRFGSHRVCDGLDPEGNVIQVMERVGNEDQ